ncbi:MAG TPA: alkaline phosphatase D family protein [Vicinamibacteria bacterium]|nr:alkaline phosphatase D family protein [Vicinamibacteria bacterium]
MTRLLFSVLVLMSLSPARIAGVRAQGPVRWVWSGAVTETTTVVKAKVDPAAGEPRLLLGEREIPASTISTSGVATFYVDGLTPDSQFDYSVRVGGSAFLSGRFHTFSEGPMSFSFVLASCARTGSNHPIFEAIESLDPLFMLHMGDFHYENIRENDPAVYRAAFEKVLASERQSSLYRSAPIAYVWDDHDYGPNDSDRTHPGRPAALATYDEYVPHYPLERDGELPRDIHQAFTVGRVRFLMTDGRSNRVPDSDPDGPDKTMLGAAQRDWLVGEIENARARYALVAWVNVVPWIAEPGSGHGWGRYDWERRYVADRIRDAGMANRMIMLSGDGHMVAIDDGTNSNFASDARPGERAFPVFHAAPLDRYARHKGGPYSHGKAGRRVLFGLVPIQQFGQVQVEDDGEVLEVTFTGRNEHGAILKGMQLRLRCEDNGCQPSG